MSSKRHPSVYADAVQEMVMAVWLIVKGFSPSAVAPEAGKDQRRTSF